MKQRITALAIILCMLLSFAGCSSRDSDETGIVDSGEGYSLKDAANTEQEQNTDDTSNTNNSSEKSNSSKTPSDKNAEQSTGGAVSDKTGGSTYSEDSDGNVTNTKTDDDYRYSYSYSDENAFIPDFGYTQSGEEYSEIEESSFKSTADAPLSTFAADVDTASYTNVRRLINSSNLSAAGNAARIEEMINYFNYDYDEPKNNAPFSATAEIFDCPWNNETNILKIGLKTPSVNTIPNSNLVFLIDVSGSMGSADKLPLIKKALSVLPDTVREGDKISIVTYASGCEVMLDGATDKNTPEMKRKINSLVASGNTNGSKGITEAYKTAEKHFIEGGNNRVIIITDGDFNVGLTSEDELKHLIESKKKSGIFLSVMGVGSGNIKDNKMETLADCGNGNYCFIDCLDEANRVLTEEMSKTLYTVAKDVKFQVEFNPAKIKGYRLIGYENRAIDDKDFADDSKDGGEIGAGQTLTVLYEIVRVDSPMKIPSQNLKYQQNDNKSDEFLTLSIRYKKPDGNTSELISYPIDKSVITHSPSEDSIFATAVAQFGMLLRGSEFTKNTSYKDIIDRISKLECIKNDKYKSEFLTLVQKASEL